MKSESRICFRSLTITVAISILFTDCKKDDDIAPILFNTSIFYGSTTDQNGNTYKTVTIGTQVWMAENLRTTNYRNGDPIPNVTDATSWDNLKTGAYCYYDNNNKYINVYGFLYNWYAVTDSRNLAPAGWHVPTTDEWEVLSNFLGGASYWWMEKKLREAGGNHWIYSIDATNESGFTALPGGMRIRWTATSGLPIKQSSRYLFLGEGYYLWIQTSSGSFDITPNSGKSIRCVKD
jgi:uncharacterized protein (TIGR02145 family)